MDFQSLMAKKLGGKYAVHQSEMDVNQMVTEWMEKDGTSVGEGGGDGENFRQDGGEGGGEISRQRNKESRHRF